MNIKPQKTQKTPKKYICEKCNYCTKNKKDFRRHEQTAKHKKNISNLVLKLYIVIDTVLSSYVTFPVVTVL